MGKQRHGHIIKLEIGYEVRYNYGCGKYYSKWFKTKKEALNFLWE